MVCCACGMRHRLPQGAAGFCDFCGCPLGALAPPRQLCEDRPQRAPVWPAEPELMQGLLPLLVLLCTGLSLLPLLAY